MPFIKNEDGTFTVTSRSGSAHKWIVSADFKSCNCPKFKYILKGRSQCHHITEVLAGQAPKEHDTRFPKFQEEKYKDILTEAKFIEIFGDDQYDELTRMQEIILHKGTVRLLK